MGLDDWTAQLHYYYRLFLAQIVVCTKLASTFKVRKGRSNSTTVQQTLYLEENIRISPKINYIEHLEVLYCLIPIYYT